MTTTLSAALPRSPGLDALARFGLGPRPGDRAAAEADPRGRLLAEIADPADLLLAASGLPTVPDLLSDIAAARAEHAAINRAIAAGEAGADPPEADMAADMAGQMDGAASGGMAGGTAAMADPPRRMTPPIGVALEIETAARLTRSATVGIGFGERLVTFWGDHFTVSRHGSGIVAGIGGAYEREAIRPHALGRFADMLLAVTRHPAMLLYLDNRSSIGPNSVAGRARPGRGLNENHARELLELHTVGPGAFGQDDVGELSRALTGWTFDVSPRANNHGTFKFTPRRHEPGARQVLGRRYPEAGVEQATAILADLARHPATARNVASRLCRAFAGEAPEPLVERLARRFLDTDGDLAALAAGLVEADEIWRAPAQLKTPRDFMLSAMRATGGLFTVRFMDRGLALLGQQFWAAPSPKGYAIDGAAWLAPDALTNRIDIAERIAARAPDTVAPLDLGDDLYGAALSDETRTAIRRAGSRVQAMTLLLMSPEFQRR